MPVLASAQADSGAFDLNLNNSDWQTFLKDEREALSDFPSELQDWLAEAREYIQNTSFLEAKNDLLNFLTSDELAGYLATQPPQFAVLGGAIERTALLFRNIAAGRDLRVLADEAGLLRLALKEKGNFGLGTATAETADRLGKAWVGDGYTVASEGDILISKDRLRQYRPPSLKQKSGRTQANFEWRPSEFDPLIPGKKQRWIGDGHLTIQDGS